MHYIGSYCPYRVCACTGYWIEKSLHVAQISLEFGLSAKMMLKICESIKLLFEGSRLPLMLLNGSRYGQLVLVYGSTQNSISIWCQTNDDSDFGAFIIAISIELQ